MIANNKIGVVILAAGSSSRLGFPKQLVEYKGKALLQRMVDLVKSLTFDSRILVLGSGVDKIKSQVKPGNITVIENNNWEEGMASSIRLGLAKALESEEELDHLLILLSDQPLVTKRQIEELIDLQINKNSRATFSEYDGDIGVPAIFSSSIFPDLEKLQGDHGAKKMIYREGFKYETLKLEEANFDVDTMNDVELLKKMEE
ncbi:nucleotidyltransferase family protein [Christiangramia sediminis]|uniref:Nucleotidyltransferase family protein n=1 Tax=Christiangramia sediminis TaxID=2881336 RepID=A0A9X1LH32_9FLAO|nr:nucleotidyltransferase family protein [Christiangramia sediminis]MCB7480162.1 nucleotidyltransferase family protein [Christiangramia sediminis]